MAPAHVPHADDWDVEVFFDGDCPLCRREIALLRRWDRRRRIRFVDIAGDRFDTADYGLSQAALLAEIHGRLPDGSWVKGIEVFRRLYTAVGWGWLVAVTRWPGVSQMLHVGYRVFAKHRLRLTGRCSAACQVR